MNESLLQNQNQNQNSTNILVLSINFDQDEIEFKNALEWIQTNRLQQTILNIEFVSIETYESNSFEQLKETLLDKNYEVLLLFMQKGYFDRWRGKEEKEQANKIMKIYNVLKLPTYFCITEQQPDSKVFEVINFIKENNMTIPREYIFNFRFDRKLSPQENVDKNDGSLSSVLLLIGILRSARFLDSQKSKTKCTFILFALLFLAIFLTITLKQSQSYDELELDFEISTDTILQQSKKYYQLKLDFEIQLNLSSNLNETIKNLTSQIKTQNETTKDLQLIIVNQGVLEENLNKTINDKEYDLNQYKEESSQRLVEIQELTKNMSQLNQYKDDLLVQVQELISEEQQLNLDIELLRKNLTDVLNETDYLNNNTIILENEIEQYKNNDSLNTHKIEELIDNITEVTVNYTKSIDELEYQLETSLSNITSQQQMLEIYKKLIDEYQKNDTHQEVAFIEQSQMIVSQQEQLNDLNYTLSQSIREKQLLDSKYNFSQTRLENCDNETFLLETENTDLKFNNSVQNDQLRNFNAQVNELNLENSNLVTQNSLLMLNKTNLQNQINELLENEENQQIITVSKQSGLKQFVDFLQEQEVIDTFMVNINNQTYNISDSQVQIIVKALEDSLTNNNQLILAKRPNSKILK